MANIARIGCTRRSGYDNTLYVDDSHYVPDGLHLKQGGHSAPDRIVLSIDQAEALFVTLDAWLVSKGR